MHLPDIAISREDIIIPDYPGVRHSNCLPDIAIRREGIIIPDYPVVWPDIEDATIYFQSNDLLPAVHFFVQIIEVIGNEQ